MSKSKGLCCCTDKKSNEEVENKISLDTITDQPVLVVQQSPVLDINIHKKDFSSFNQSESNIISKNSNFDKETITENQIS